MIPIWLLRIGALASIGACVVVAVIDGVRGWPTGGFHVLYGAVATVFVAVGWLLAERRPANMIGPLLALFGGAFAWYLPADLYLHLPGDLPGAVFAALFISSLDAPMFILLALILIRFPDGRLAAPGWWLTTPAAAIGIVLAPLGYVLDARPMPIFPAYVSPFGIEGLPGHELVYAAYLVMLPLLVLSALSLVVRWRRGDSVAKAQIKWVAAATFAMLATEIVNVATFKPEAPDAVTTTVSTVGIALVPIAIGIAVLRYRLFDIDRIVSRTIAYGAVTAILGAVFVIGILALQGLLAPFTQHQTISVAASTLAVYALFQPLGRRVRDAVDQRFDRSRYDADQTVGTFAARLRGDLDLATVGAEIVGTASAAVRPTFAGIWLREPGR